MTVDLEEIKGEHKEECDPTEKGNVSLMEDPEMKEERNVNVTKEQNHEADTSPKM